MGLATKNTMTVGHEEHEVFLVLIGLRAHRGSYLVIIVACHSNGSRIAVAFVAAGAAETTSHKL
jgi:hypothetical protein